MAKIDEFFYDSYWAEHGQEDTSSDEINRHRAILHLMRRIRFSKRPRMLDIGCGCGALSNKLSKIGDVIGIDISGCAIEIASKRYPIIRFLHQDFLDMPIEEGRYDLVITSEVLEHIPAKLQDKFIKRIHRCLSKGGHLILTTPNKVTALRLKIVGNQLRENWFTAQELSSLLLKNGFRVIKIRSAHVAANHPFFQKLFWRHRVIYNYVCEFPLTYTQWGLYLVVHARKEGKGT